MTVVLPITLTIAGAAALINVWIAGRVASVRRRTGIVIGDGGNEALAARMRAHSNFIEYAPLFLILLGLVELAGGSHIWLWLAGVAFVLGRVLHVFGMDRSTLNPLRGIGIGLTLLSLLGVAFYALAIPYLHKEGRETITYARASTLSATNGLVRRS
ncbi:MAG: MAPEG family protein [Sphingomonadales bacterium]